MAPIEVFSRVEHKYIIDSAVYKNIRNQLKDYMYEDGFSTDGGFYTICNIYYDTATDELIRKSLEKPVYKEKLRLRSYGRADDDTKVFLEIKKKFKGVVNKRRTVLKLKEAYDFTETYRQPEYRDYMNKQVLNELEYFMNHYKPVPKVFLAYDRAALFCKDDPELRITFDTNIRTRRDNLRLDSNDKGELLIDKGKWLMEIKVINAYPLWLVDILNSNGLFKTSFSKYGTEYLKNKLI
ncbi:MAG: polyphosphate polymerase domain-containing protein [Lachnospiraceae bacterium]|nr:polyphosphate polymerase domain-containing protein [Lachnospiraceae bacterium]MDE6253382.1 polyphosphate polymerase domain-containing protein [Lachnospiraceae bacterium]